MKTFLKIILIIFIGVVAISALFSLLGAVLGIAFGVVGTLFGFVWRVIFSPAIVIVLIVFVVLKLRKKSGQRQ